MTLQEMLLLEAIGERTLYHYTGFRELLLILKQKKFSMNRYLGTKDGEVQFCTVRPSMSSKSDDLSGASNGGVKFVIDGSKLSDTVRGVKIKTIAEFPIQYIEDMKRNLKTATGHTFTDKDMNSLLKDLKNFKNKHKIDTSKRTDIEDLNDEQKKELKEISKKHYNVQPSYLMMKIGSIFTDRHGLQKYTRDREGEERITKKGNLGCTSFPLDKKYVKIEITKPNMLKVHRANSDEEIKELYKLMKKNEDLFTKNYDKIMETIKMYIDKIDTYKKAREHVKKES